MLTISSTPVPVRPSHGEPVPPGKVGQHTVHLQGGLWFLRLPVMNHRKYLYTEILSTKLHKQEKVSMANQLELLPLQPGTHLAETVLDVRTNVHPF